MRTPARIRLSRRALEGLHHMQGVSRDIDRRPVPLATLARFLVLDLSGPQDFHPQALREDRSHDEHAIKVSLSEEEWAEVDRLRGVAISRTTYCAAAISTQVRQRGYYPPR